MPIPRLTMACGLSIMSMVLCAMTLRSFMGNATIDEMGARTSPARHHALLCNTGDGVENRINFAWQMV